MNLPKNARLSFLYRMVGSSPKFLGAVVMYLESFPNQNSPTISTDEPKLLTPGLYLDFAFKPEDTHVLIDTPEQVFAEYVAHPTRYPAQPPAPRCSVLEVMPRPRGR
jgi:hypothetical protein